MSLGTTHTPTMAAGLFIVFAIVLLFYAIRRAITSHRAEARHTLGEVPMSTHEDVVADTPDADDPARIPIPRTGVLVPEGIVRGTKRSGLTVHEALVATTTPVALEYKVVSDIDMNKYRTVPINASIQQALTGILEHVHPGGDMIMKCVLPDGASLVDALGHPGWYRGFSRTDGQTAHALLQPAGRRTAVAGNWSLLAVGGVVMVLDAIAQHEQQDYQERIERSLLRLEEHRYDDLIASQHTVDSQLTRLGHQLLDGACPNLEVSLWAADEHFQRSQSFTKQLGEKVRAICTGDGPIDHRKLEVIVGKNAQDLQRFCIELQLARAAIPLARKALTIDAADVALRSSGNPYEAMVNHLRGRALQIDATEAELASITEQLMSLELTGPWFHRGSKASTRQNTLRIAVAPPAPTGAPQELLLLARPTGEILELRQGDAELER